MSKPSLYTDQGNATMIGCELETRTRVALAPVFDNFIKMGYDPRDISHHIIHTVLGLEVEQILGWRATVSAKGKG
jgi:hypothetical protein